MRKATLIFKRSGCSNVLLPVLSAIYLRRLRPVLVLQLARSAIPPPACAETARYCPTSVRALLLLLQRVRVLCRRRSRFREKTCTEHRLPLDPIAPLSARVSMLHVSEGTGKSQPITPRMERPAPVLHGSYCDTVRVLLHVSVETSMRRRLRTTPIPAAVRHTRANLRAATISRLPLHRRPPLPPPFPSPSPPLRALPPRRWPCPQPRTGDARRCSSQGSGAPRPSTAERKVQEEERRE